MYHTEDFLLYGVEITQGRRGRSVKQDIMLITVARRCLHYAGVGHTQLFLLAYVTWRGDARGRLL